MLRTLGAARAGARIRRGKAQPVEGDPSAAPLPLTRATVIRARPFDGDDAAATWLDRVSAERELWAPLAVEAARQINLALHVHRTATGDPYLADVHPARAAAIRFGYGTGDEVADGRWRDAREMAERDRLKLLSRDLEALRPQERMAAVLGGRELVGAHEELIVRARADLEAGRLATAALGLHAGLEAMTRLAASGPGVAEAAGIARSARQRVLEGGEPDGEQLERCLRAAEVAMRRRALD